MNKKFDKLNMMHASNWQYSTPVLTTKTKASTVLVTLAVTFLSASWSHCELNCTGHTYCVCVCVCFRRSPKPARSQL